MTSASKGADKGGESSQGVLVPREDEMMTPLTEYQFFTVWTEAAGRPGYDKALFAEIFESLKSRDLIIPSRLPRVDGPLAKSIRRRLKLLATPNVAGRAKDFTHQG